MKKTMKAGLLVLMIAMLFQTGLSVFAEVTREDSDQSGEAGDLQSVTLTEAVKEALLEQYPEASEQAITMYKQFLIEFDVHPLLQESTDQWLLQGVPLSDMLVAYAYLYHQFGVMEEIEPMLAERSSGKTWADLFTQYQETHAPFVPRAFDPELLERLHDTSGMTSDDIMIADMIAFVTEADVEAIIERKMESGESWQDITAANGILYGAENLPRVPVRMEQIETFLHSTELTEDQIIEGFVLAYKTGADVESVLQRLDEGSTEETIFAEELVRIYSME